MQATAAGPGEERGGVRRARVLAVAVPALWLVAGLVWFGADLGRADVVVFDEVHYLKASRAFANGTWIEPAWPDFRPYNWEHPPLAKYWIAGSIAAFGDDPVAHRLPSVLHGALGLAGLSVLARRLFGTPLAGVVAPLLLALDPMWYVLSRLAMLEVFVAAPMVWAFAFAFGARPWERWGAGAAAGYALAAKYTALFLLPMLLLVLFFRDVRGPKDARRVRALGRPLGRALSAAFAVPLGLFLLSYLPFLVEFARHGGPWFMVRHWVFLFTESLSWGAVGPQSHPELTPPLLWLPMVRPTWMYFEWGAGEGATRLVGLIYALGNPVVWWGALAFAVAVLAGPALRVLVRLRAAAAVAGGWRLRIDARDAHHWSTMGVAVLLFATAYAPYFLLARATFLYYMGFLVPWLALMATGGLVWLVHLDRPVVASAAPAPATEGGPGGDAAAVVGTRVGAWRWAWMRAWLGPIAVVLFVVAAAALYVHWWPLFSAVPYERAVADRAWDVVPWMERIAW